MAQGFEQHVVVKDIGSRIEEDLEKISRKNMESEKDKEKNITKCVTTRKKKC